MFSEHIFISSVFSSDEILKIRGLIRNKVSNAINYKLNEIRRNLYYYDFEVGIRDGVGKLYAAITCLNKINQSNLFIGIIDENTGQCIVEKDIEVFYSGILSEKMNDDFLKYEKKIKDAIKNKRSVLELEFREAFQNENIKKLIYKKKGIKNKSIEKFFKDFGVTEIREYDNCDKLIDEMIEDILNFYEEIYSKEFGEFSQKEKDYNRLYTFKNRNFVNVKEYFEEINGYLSNEKKPIIIQGEEGIGKSSFINKIIETTFEGRRRVLLNLQLEREILNESELIERVNLELEKIIGIKNQKRDDLTFFHDHQIDEIKILNKFSELANKLKEKLVIIIDDFHVIENYTMKTLWWLPESLPDNLQFILITRDSFKKIDEKKFNIINIKGMKDKKEELIENIAYEYGKEDEMEFFKNITKSDNPLNIKWLINFVILTQKYNDLGNKTYNDTTNIKDLSKELIDVLISIYDNIYGKNFIKICFVPILLSKNGIKISEMKRYLKNKGIEKEGAFEQLYYDIRYIFTEQNGLITFAYSSVREAVEENLVKDKIQEERINFTKDFEFLSENIERFAVEMPWQYYEIFKNEEKNIQEEYLVKIKEVLSKPYVFYNLYLKLEENIIELFLGFKSIDMDLWYEKIKKKIFQLKSEDEINKVNEKLMEFLFYFGYNKKVKKLCDQWLEIVEDDFKKLKIREHRMRCKFLIPNSGDLEEEFNNIIQGYKNKYPEIYPYEIKYFYALFLKSKNRIEESLEILRGCYKKRSEKFTDRDPYSLTFLAYIINMEYKLKIKCTESKNIHYVYNLAKEVFLELRSELIDIEILIAELLLEAKQYNEALELLNNIAIKMKKIYKGRVTTQVVLLNEFIVIGLSETGEKLKAMYKCEKTIINAKVILSGNSEHILRLRSHMLNFYKDIYKNYKFDIFSEIDDLEFHMIALNILKESEEINNVVNKVLESQSENLEYGYQLISIYEDILDEIKKYHKKELEEDCRRVLFMIYKRFED
ncbi:ATP-binding protein [Oceanirhabdus sp. W0125-5]|uniref:ATP-binding protein n=1 Tax=Oceanirhabdus sp. W0125-5 TaxID=2999116 RepID=UPI0022F2BEB1|nr:ATP-binding protein [Oceanirhabdus sp. W0125-5]WBW98851.1 ATP-binding protein [Oceanirhabdus sp. W0125-5]